MPHDQKRLTRRRLQVLFGLILAGILYSEFELHGDYEPIIRKGEVLLAAEPPAADRFERL